MLVILFADAVCLNGRMGDLRDMRILLAEDNEATGQMYKSFLETKGFKVDLAINGLQAFELAHEGGYNLILMDVRMPKLDGIEVLQRLKDDPPKEKNGPIVMLTNLYDEFMVKQSVSLGALSYMDKSNLNPEELVEKVKGVLGIPEAGEVN